MDMKADAEAIYIVDDDPAVRDALSVDRQLARWEEFTDRSRITAVEYSAHDNVLDPYMDWLGIPPEKRPDLTIGSDDPNRALDEQSLRVFLEVKRRSGHVDRMAMSRIGMLSWQRGLSSGSKLGPAPGAVKGSKIST